MTLLMEKVSLEPTSAAVLLFAQRIYEDNAHIAQYLQQIDLSSGVPVVEAMKTVIRHAVEMLENRKYFFHDYILNQIGAKSHDAQIVIVGAGYDPISVHLLDVAADKIKSIFEIDMSSFDAKAAIFRAINVPHLEKISFIQANVMMDNTLDIIRAHGHDDAKPAVIALEGLVPYIDEAHFVDLVEAFRSPDQKNAFCVDYAMHWTEAPTEELCREYKSMVTAIERQVGREVTYYTTDKVTNLLKKLGATSIKVTIQKEVERRRTGQNRCFTQKGEGLIEFVTFNI